MAFSRPRKLRYVCWCAARPYVSQTATNHPPAIALEWKILSLACALMTMSVPFAQFCISASSLISERVYRQCTARAERKIKFVVYLKKKGWSRSEFMAACATPAASPGLVGLPSLFFFFCVNCLREQKQNHNALNLPALHAPLIRISRGVELFGWPYTLQCVFIKQIVFF